MTKSLKSALFVLLLPVIPAGSAQAQSLVSASDVRLVNKYLDQETLKADLLKCDLKAFGPFLDFAFRFDVGYVVICPLKEFSGRESTVLAIVRVTPEGGIAVVLGEAYKLPAISDAMRARINPDKLKQKMDFSGSFAAGEGRYVVEVLIVDKRTYRMCRRRWTVDVARKHKERQVPLNVSEHTVIPTTFLPWNGQLNATGRRLRVTVLLDVAPMYPFALKLRASDSSFLLSTLSSVTAQIDCESVRLVAFNLDQQKEVYREDQFDAAGFDKLAQAIRSLELSTISYQTLQNRGGSLDLLIRLANSERAAPNPSDVVIFLGPQSRFYQKVPAQFFPSAGEGNPKFFYLEYMPPWRLGAEFPDSVEYVTKALDGTSYKVHSPPDLANALGKIAAQVGRQEKKPTADSGL